jgi:hypothetical protein
MSRGSLLFDPSTYSAHEKLRHGRELEIRAFRLEVVPVSGTEWRLG